MENSIRINIKDETCDIEIKNFPLTRINNLSTITEAVAESLKSTLVLIGMEPEKATQGINLLLQGKLDIRGILRATSSIKENHHG